MLVARTLGLAQERQAAAVELNTHASAMLTCLILKAYNKEHRSIYKVPDCQALNKTVFFERFEKNNILLCITKKLRETSQAEVSFLREIFYAELF